MDYLKDRFLYTVVNGHSSNLDDVTYGVPQRIPPGSKALYHLR